MQYPTEVKYKSRAKDMVNGKKKKLSTIVDRTKKFPSRNKAKKFLKDHPLKQFVSLTSEGRPEPVVEE